MQMMKTLSAAVVAVGVVMSVGSVDAASKGPKPPSQDWSFQGIFGTYDKAALQRGFQVYKNVCAACHGLSRIAFRNLEDLGYSEDEIKSLASEYEVRDGPNEEGEMFFREATPADRWPSPFPNKQAAQFANGGAYPLDLSLITKARAGGGDSAIRVSMLQPTGFAIGADYIYALLTGYKDEPPEGVEISDTQYYNEYYPGNAISMAQPLYDGSVEYADGTEATISQMAHDVATFLTWTAEPELDERKNMGLKVILFLIVFTAMLYALKRKIWADLH